MRRTKIDPFEGFYFHNEGLAIVSNCQSIKLLFINICKYIRFYDNRPFIKKNNYKLILPSEAFEVKRNLTVSKCNFLSISEINQLHTKSMLGITTIDKT